MVQLMQFLFWFNTVGFLISMPFLLMILFLAGSPIFAIISAKIKKAPLILLERKDGNMGLITGDYSGGTIDNKRYGAFITDPRAMRPFYGTPMGVAYEKVGHTPTREFVEATKNLSEVGIKDYTEAVDLEPTIAEQIGEAKGEEKTKLESILMDIALIKDYFKHTINPSQLSEKIATAIRYREGKKSREVLTWAAGIGFAVFMVAIAFYIITNAMGQPSFGSMADTCREIYGFAKPIASNTTVVRQPSII